MADFKSNVRCFTDYYVLIVNMNNTFMKKKIMQWLNKWWILKNLLNWHFIFDSTCEYLGYNIIKFFVLMD